MAGPAGFEPANAGIKTRCLTTWRRPNDLLPTEISKEKISKKKNPMRNYTHLAKKQATDLSLLQHKPQTLLYIL